MTTSCSDYSIWQSSVKDIWQIVIIIIIIIIKIIIISLTIETLLLYYNIRLALYHYFYDYTIPMASSWVGNRIEPKLTELRFRCYMPVINP